MHSGSMQACALVRDPALVHASYMEIRGTTLSASDLHNAWANILNPFYNMVNTRSTLERR